MYGVRVYGVPTGSKASGTCRPAARKKKAMSEWKTSADTMRKPRG